MSDYKKILELIEAVDPSDRAALDEIDAKVQWYIGITQEPIVLPISYTRSRDALKAIRPEGWEFDVCNVFGCKDGSYEYTVYNGKHSIESPSPPLGRRFKTEELAELHAIIKAIAHDREES